uniref:Uncharacterized protein n=1 Tax=Anguilla anguilla TaxID=7936 RepID=A0A0E9P6E6_ANGAN
MTFSSKLCFSVFFSKVRRWKSTMRYLCLWPPPMPAVHSLPVWSLPPVFLLANWSDGVLGSLFPKSAVLRQGNPCEKSAPLHRRGAQLCVNRMTVADHRPQGSVAPSRRGEAASQGAA